MRPTNLRVRAAVFVLAALPLIAHAQNVLGTAQDPCAPWRLQQLNDPPAQITCVSIVSMQRTGNALDQVAKKFTIQDADSQVQSLIAEVNDLIARSTSGYVFSDEEIAKHKALGGSTTAFLAKAGLLIYRPNGGGGVLNSRPAVNAAFVEKALGSLAILDRDAEQIHRQQTRAAEEAGRANVIAQNADASSAAPAAERAPSVAEPPAAMLPTIASPLPSFLPPALRGLPEAPSPPAAAPDAEQGQSVAESPAASSAAPAGRVPASVAGSNSSSRQVRQIPIVTISAADEKQFQATYYNCDHEGEDGCLGMECNLSLSNQNPSEVQYLYKDVWQTTPEVLTDKDTECFLHAGGKFQASPSDATAEIPGAQTAAPASVAGSNSAERMDAWGAILIITGIAALIAGFVPPRATNFRRQVAYLGAGLFIAGVVLIAIGTPTEQNPTSGKAPLAASSATDGAQESTIAPSPPTTVLGPRVATPNASCKSDWRACSDNADLVNNYGKIVDSQVACKSEAQGRAKFGTPKFPFLFFFGKFYKGDEYVKTGVIKLIEDDAQFSNVFGAMVHSTVTCTYDLDQEKVVDISIGAN